MLMKFIDPIGVYLVEVWPVSNFKTCSKCDFEWHLTDGDNCPVCTKEKTEKHGRGGVFGTSKNQDRLNLWFKALGMVALVLLLYHFVGN